jgi:hypothetical protein
LSTSEIRKNGRQMWAIRDVNLVGRGPGGEGRNPFFAWKGTTGVRDPNTSTNHPFGRTELR